jgi:LuxR family maltose regulon positive regulatory protein
MGDVDDGLILVEQMAQFANRANNQLATVLMLTEIAELRLKQFKVDEAEDLYRRALAISKTADGTLLPIAGQALIGLGDIAVERFDPQAAERLLNEGIELAKRWSLVNTLQGHLSLAFLYETLQQLAAAREAGLEGLPTLLQDTLATLEDLARRFDATEFDDIVVEMIKMRIYLHQGRLDAVRQWVFDRGLERLPAQQPAYHDDGTMVSRLYKYELPILARWHIAEGRYQDALAILHELARLAEDAGRPYLLVESLILQARVFQLLKDNHSALENLKKALDMAGPHQARRLFLVEGQEILRLLEAGRQQWEAADTAEFVDSLLNIWRGYSSPEVVTGPAQLAGTLSSRELEVLRLLPTGLTAVQMADELFISANTLRSHLKNIYAKLGVHSRHEAVARANELELL